MKHLLFIVPGGRFLPLQFADAIPILASENSYINYRTEMSLASGFPLWEVSTTVLALFSCFLLYIFFRQKKRAASQRYRSTEQLRLIRSLLDLCYTYRESPAVFLDKFKDKVNIRELKSYTLIEEPKDRFQRLKEDERLLCLLLEAGFTHRELCVVFNLKKTSNLYTKYHRIQQKLTDRKPCDPPATENC